MLKRNAFSSRYQSGEHRAVWKELMALGESVNDPRHFDEAYTVAHETMQRVRINIEVLHQKLGDLGYQFANPQQVHVSPNPKTQDFIVELEKTLGPLPLSLTVFYEVVGSINFTQSHNQLVHYYEPNRSKIGDLYILGEEDPLYIYPIEELTERMTTFDNRPHLNISPDEFHKACYSGGQDYHVSLPHQFADFYIGGMYGIKESFVEYLRKSIQHGGFRGCISTDDGITCEKPPPANTIIELVTKDLVPF